MRLYYGEYKDFNDCALRLVKNYNEQEVAPVGGQETAAKRMQYRDAIKVLTVYAYHSVVKFFAPRGVHKQHLTALGSPSSKPPTSLAANFEMCASLARRSHNADMIGIWFAPTVRAVRRPWKNSWPPPKG